MLQKSTVMDSNPWDSLTKRSDMSEEDRKAGIEENYRKLFGDAQTVEMRAPSSKKVVYSGYYNDPAKFARDALKLESLGTNVYWTLNPLKGDLLARRSNKYVKDYSGGATSDEHVTRRDRFVIDVDPERISGISATDEEKKASEEGAKKCVAWLKERGWPDAEFVADSGNGYHISYRLELPNTEASRQLVQRVLQALDVMFSTQDTHIDVTMFNASRICKVYGTKAQKGEDLEGRPHRISRMLLHNPDAQSVSEEQLRSVAGIYVEPPPKAKKGKGTGAYRFDTEAFIEFAELEVSKTRQARNGGTIHEFEVCPLNPEHDDRSSIMISHDEGPPSFHCNHNGCRGGANLYPEVREQYAEFFALEAGRHQGGNSKEKPGAPECLSDDAMTEAVKLAEDRHLGTVEVKLVEWCWKHRLPRRKIIVLEGEPGQGKSLITVDFAARVSAGKPFPGETVKPDPALVLLFSTEDDADDTIKPRLEAAGGDPTNVICMETIPTKDGGEVSLSFPSQAKFLERLVEKTGAKLVVIDPVMGFLDPDINSNNPQSVRRALRPLRRIASRTGCIIILVNHFNKSGSAKPVEKGTGSVSFLGVARVGLQVGVHPDAVGSEDPDKLRVLAPAKANLSREPKAYEYRIKANSAVPSNPYVEWAGESGVRAEDLLEQQPTSAERGEADEAVEFLRALLKDGPVPSEAMFKQAKVALNVTSDKTVRRALKKGGFKSGKLPGDATWSWWDPETYNPEKPDPDGDGGGQVGQDAHEGLSKEKAGGAGEESPQQPPLTYTDVQHVQHPLKSSNLQGEHVGHQVRHSDVQHDQNVQHEDSKRGGNPLQAVEGELAGKLDNLDTVSNMDVQHETPAKSEKNGHVGHVGHGKGGVGNYTPIFHEDGLQEAISTLQGAELLGLDIETTGLLPHKGVVRLVQVSDGERTYVVDAWRVNPKMLLEMVYSGDWVAHNAAFEISWISYHYDLEACDSSHHECTMMMSNALRAGETEWKKKKDGTMYRTEVEHGLKDVARRELGVEMSKEMQTSDWSAEELSEEQLNYAALDAAVLVPLRDRLRAELEKEA
jgi:KaiC/GvpD/RAD55 family RecA-like ATPase